MVTPGVKERQERQVELMSRGFTLEGVRNLGGQPKLDYYRHAPMLTVKGAIAKTRAGEATGDVGKLISNQPGDAETAMKLSSRGILPWPPGEYCQCKACRERYGTQYNGQHVVTPGQASAKAMPRAPDFTGAEDEDVEAQQAPVLDSYELTDGRQRCPDCDYVTVVGRDPRLAMMGHRRKHSPKAKKIRKKAA